MKIEKTKPCTCGGRMHLLKTKPQIQKYECEKCGLRYVDHGNWGEWYRHKVCPKCGGEMRSEQNYFTYEHQWICRKCRHRLK